jgi:glycosyltransferase involved in cell wall biosynthesis
MRVDLVDPSLFTLPYDAALARGLQNAGCRVTLHGRATHAADGGCEGVDLAAHFYPLAESRLVRPLPKTLRLAIKGVDHFASMMRLLRRLRKTRPDVIHFQWLPLPLIDANLLSRFRSLAPLVLTVHDTDPFNGNPAARLQRIGVKRALSGFDQLIVHTRQGHNRLLKQGALPSKTAILPHGSLSSARSATVDAMQGPITLMLFGKIKRYKGADILIDAFAALPPALQKDVRVRIVGQPYMELSGLREQAKALGVGHAVSIEPVFVADDDIDALFGPGTIAVFPYREIEASGVLSYAMTNGRPIVASRLGSFAEMLRDGVHGRLVAPDDAAALTQALEALLNDRHAASACAAEVRALATDVPDWDDIARRTLTIYQDLAVARLAKPYEIRARREDEELLF